MSEVKVNKISPRTNCGTTQLGDSGDTFTLPSGGTLTIACGATITNNGTQTGFGRTGTVDWDTTAKTANFTAVSGNGYFVNTTSGAITVTLPATPSAGDIVAIADYAGTAATNPITIDRNGSNLEGGTTNANIYEDRDAQTYIYVDATQGWVPVYANEKSGILPPAYIAASGGTVITCGDFKTHVFTGPGTFTVTCAGNINGSNKVSYMVVAGGGGGRGFTGGGGGAGGFREGKDSTTPYTASPLDAGSGLPVSVTSYPITVGAGGAGGSCAPPGQAVKGSNSIFSSITSTGGGSGGPNCKTGGSGGNGGAGNTPPVSPPQGQPAPGGAGGGAVEAGSTDGPRDGGDGAGTQITTSPSYGTPGTTAGLRYFAGGGGSGNHSDPASPPGGVGGEGGGGPGGPFGPTPVGTGTAGTTNTGGGGGGAGGHVGVNPGVGAAGGSGIVIIKYKFQ